jgi:hypothetical protein
MVNPLESFHDWTRDNELLVSGPCFLQLHPHEVREYSVDLGRGPIILGVGFDQDHGYEVGLNSGSI